MYIPTTGLGGIRVGVDIWELMPGVQLVDLFKVSGSTAEFYRWYNDLAGVLSPLMTRPPPEKEAGRGEGHRRINAFELVGSSFNLGGMFEAAEERGAGEAPPGTRTRQFSSRQAADEILAEVERAAVELGAQVTRDGEHRAVLRLPLRDGRAMPLRVRLLRILGDTYVCQTTKDEEGSPLEFFRFYGRLAARLQPIMMKAAAGPPPSRSSSGQLMDLGSVAEGR